jgi:hypothetical protein
LSMEDYPQDVLELEERFSSEEACREYLFALRWPEGFRCLKRWLLGTHQGAVRPSHLDYYLDEFTFRFNRRTSRFRGKLFYRLVQQAVAVDPLPYQQIRGGTEPPQPDPTNGKPD